MDDKVICVTVLIMLVISTSGFLFDADCHVVAPCTCWLYSLHCEYKSLTTLPLFKNTSVTLTNTWYLNFTGNSISGIRDNAFIGLETVNTAGNDIQLLLGSNNLTVSGIEDGAFNGINNMTSYLDLSSNKLTAVPVAVSKLFYLKELHLDSNPIASVNEQVFISIGHVLERLVISYTVQTWPQAFHHLPVLKYLKISDYKYDFQYDAFNGFRGTLQQLVFHNVTFMYIPSAVCSLEKLTILNITNDLDLIGGGGNIVHCNPALSTVQSIMFNGDNNQYFPNLFISFPYLHEVYITSSKISFIDDSLISTNSQLKRLTIADSQLSSIPGVINKFTSIVFCDLHSNMIQSVERYSLGHVSRYSSLQYLTRLDLRNNPIVFISKDAFPNLVALLSIDLRETRLTRIPQAIQGVTSLTSIDLRNNRIFCDCDASWLKTWASTSSAVIDGICETSNELIRNFVTIKVPHCP